MPVNASTNPKCGALKRGFTLLEVVLAMGIAAGILTVVLFFYRQSEMLRNRLLEETSRLAAARLVLERLNTELSAARRCESLQQGLSGGPESLQFVKLDFPLAHAGTNSAGIFSSSTPFRQVCYALLQDTNAGTTGGLLRSEEPLSAAPALTATNETSVTAEPSPPARPAGLAATQVQFLRFRYYDGAAWRESWNLPDLPVGIEVSLGNEPLPAELTPEEYPFELYRRVIYLPNHAAGGSLSLAQPRAAEEAAP